MENSSLGKRGIESLRNGEEIIEAILETQKLRDSFMEYEDNYMSWEKKGKVGQAPNQPDMPSLMGANSIPE